jgi:hypothetical protein
MRYILAPVQEAAVYRYTMEFMPPQMLGAPALLPVPPGLDLREPFGLSGVTRQQGTKGGRR